jgi:hypothetical protein
VQATWSAVSFTLQGAISTSDIQFSGTSPGPWTINQGATPLVLTNMLITFDYTFGTSTTGELRGTVTWGRMPPITGIMKYPADPQASGCFSVTVIIGTPSGDTSTLDGLAQQVVGGGAPSSNFPPDSKELFGNTLQDVTLSVYPDCGSFYIGAQLSTTTFGEVSMSLALFEYAPVSAMLQAFADGLPDDPPVPLSSSSYTVGAKEALTSAAIAFATVQPALLVPQAYVIRQRVGQAMSTIMSTVSAMRQQLLVQVCLCRFCSALCLSLSLCLSLCLSRILQLRSSPNTRSKSTHKSSCKRSRRHCSPRPGMRRTAMRTTHGNGRCG